jgi:hypothetical protein
MTRRIFPLLAVLAVLSLAAGPARALDNSWFDRYHASLERDLYGTTAWFDRFFGEELLSQADNTYSSAQLTTDFRWDDRDGFEYRVRARLRIRLPLLKGRLRLLISGENQGDPNATTPEDPGNPGLSQLATDGRASTELAYDLLRTRNTILFAGVGVRIRTDPTAFTRVRLVHARELGHQVIGRFAVTPYWDARDGFGETNEINFERPLGPATMMYWINTTDMNESRDGLGLATDLSVRRLLSPQSAVTVGAGVTGRTRPSTVAENYRVYTRYRRNFLRSWLYYEIEPDINWPRGDGGSRGAVLGGTVRLEINFTGRTPMPGPP